MPRNDDSPRSVASVIDPAREFEPAILEAVKKFRRAKPWQGTPAERLAKFETLNAELSAAYELDPVPAVAFVPGPRIVAGVSLGSGGQFNPDRNTIGLWGKLSVVTYFHIFCIARGQPKRECFAWSLNLFAKMFRVSYARAAARGPILLSQ